MDKQIRDGFMELKQACEELNINLRELIARVAIFPPKEAVEKLANSNPPYVVVPNCRRLKRTEKEKRGQKGKVWLDDNSKANEAIKRVLGRRKYFKNYEACHIWPGTCYDVNCHTALPNLVLIPRGIASLSDHIDEIMQDLQYRAYELYQWHPANFMKPTKPEGYPDKWRAERTEYNHKLEEIVFEQKKDRSVLPIEHTPADKTLFKKALIETRIATITVHYDTGEVAITDWNLRNFSENSDPTHVIRSMKKFRRDQWLKNGILYLEVTIPGYEGV